MCKVSITTTAACISGHLLGKSNLKTGNPIIHQHSVWIENTLFKYYPYSAYILYIQWLGLWLELQYFILKLLVIAFPFARGHSKQ